MCVCVSSVLRVCASFAYACHCSTLSCRPSPQALTFIKHQSKTWELLLSSRHVHMLAVSQHTMKPKQCNPKSRTNNRQPPITWITGPKIILHNNARSEVIRVLVIIQVPSRAVTLCHFSFGQKCLCCVLEHSVSPRLPQKKQLLLLQKDCTLAQT